MLQTDKARLQPPCNRPATADAPASNRMLSSQQPRAIQPAAACVQLRIACVQPAPSLLATHHQGGADAAGLPAPGPAPGGLAHRAHRARALPQGARHPDPDPRHPDPDH
eukprot:scaffold88386_cov57-Phaeocystis_antarctica.AAC.2